jgi:hypothetical protein
MISDENIRKSTDKLDQIANERFEKVLVLKEGHIKLLNKFIDSIKC